MHGVASPGSRLLAGFFVSAALLGVAVANAAPPVVPRMAPGLSWPRPPVTVFLDCTSAEARQPALLALGTALLEQGFHVQRGPAPSDATGIAAVVRCMPAATTPSAPPPPPVPPVVEVRLSMSSSEAVATADQVAALAFPKIASPHPVRFLFLVEDRSDTGRSLLVQASWVVEYAHLAADFADLSRLEGLPPRWLGGYDAVVLATDRLPRTRLDRIVGALDRYVRDGGALVNVAGVEDPELYPLFGIRKAEGTAQVETYRCDPSFLPGAEGLDPVLPPDGLDTIPRFVPAKDTRVLCRGGKAGAPDAPMAFVARTGKGQAIGWAGSGLADKSSRGRILLSLLEVAPAAAAILDALAFYADDCPLPMTNSLRPPADRLYHLTDSGFYRTMWWPRMHDLLQKHAIRPTTGFILTYDDRMPHDAPPQAYTPPEGEPALELAREIRDAGWEIGLHGYNHQSLSIGKNEWTVGWAGRAPMEEALRLLRDEFQRIFGPGAEPPVYIAPSNFIQKMGKEALKAAFPAITGIAGQYLDEGPILGQEFGPDPDVPSLVGLPRVTSEHFLDGGNSQEFLGALVVPGVFSHFVHPDDFFDPERSRDATFEEMVERLDRMLSVVDRAYPFLRRFTGSELARYVPAWRKARLDVLRDGNSLLVRAIDPPQEGMTVMVRPPRGTTVRFQGACEEAFREPVESRYYYRVGSEACAISWQ